MNTKQISPWLLTFSLALCMPLAVNADGHGLKDGGFEDQLAPNQGGWVMFDNSRISIDHARTGKTSMFNWGFSRTQPLPPFLIGGASGSFQEFAAEPGSRWRLSGYGMAANSIKGQAAYGILQISFFDAEGNDLGTVETDDNDSKTAMAKTSKQINSKTRVGEWVMLDTGVATAPAGTTAIHAFTLFVDYSGAGISQGVHFDDLSLCQLAAGSDSCD